MCDPDNSFGSHFYTQYQEDQVDDGNGQMEENKALCDLLDLPVPILTAVIVEWCTDALHEVLLGKAADAQLEQGRSAIQDLWQTDDEIGERIGGSQCEESKENANGLRTGITHQKDAWITVEPQIDAQYNSQIDHDVVHHGTLSADDGHKEECGCRDHG